MMPRTLLASAVLLFAACGVAGTGPGPGVREPDLYEGCATDENWRVFDAYETSGRIRTDPGAVPRWTASPAEVSRPASAPPTLSWQPSVQSPGSPGGDIQCASAQAAAPGLSSMSLTPEHLPPVTGIVYDVHVASDGTDLFRVLTSRQETSLPGPLWASWAGKTVTVDLIEAPLIKNAVSDGPYRATPLTISITP